ncbi:MAG: flagellar export chaperone FliS [Pseudohongiellaceae bacterium]
MNIMVKNALSSYQDVGYTASVDYSDPHQLVGMLFNALLESLADARRHLSAADLVSKGRSIARAQKIIYGLRSTLDFKRGGELARNLDALYDYCLRRLSLANAENDPAVLAEVASLLGEISEAWHLMPNRVFPEQQ